MSAQHRKRNHLCPCGSGKKFKNCCRDKKARDQKFFAVSKPIGTWFSKGVIPAGTKFTVQHSNGQMRIFQDETEIPFGPMYVTNSYPRAGKKNKILRQVPLPTFSPQDMLEPAAINVTLPSYDWIFIIDTNTKTISGKDYSAACSIISKTELNRDNTITFHYQGFASFQYQGLAAADAEKQALVDLIKLITNNPAFHPPKVIGIVTDHDLGSHMSLNNHEVPIRDGSMLPSNFKILYASADSGSENPLNRAITLCDKAASEILKKTIYSAAQ